MPIFDYIAKEVRLKVTLFGPAGGGKRTTLAKLKSCAPAAVETIDDAGFTYLVEKAGGFQDFKTRIAFHAASNEEANVSRKALLRDVDTIIFTADSQWEQLEENVKSLQELERILALEDCTLESVPYILQYNKRDLAETAPRNYMDFLVNGRAVPVEPIETSALNGDGVAALLAAAEERALAGIPLAATSS